MTEKLVTAKEPLAFEEALKVLKRKKASVATSLGLYVAEGMCHILRVLALHGVAALVARGG